MENKEDSASKLPPEVRQEKHINYFAEDDTEDNFDTGKKRVESSRQKNDAGSGNDGSFDEMLQNEKLIDPGNEHHHRTDADDKIFDDDIDRSPRDDADAGGDGTGTTNS